ncbi:hypothetical protein Ancab_032253 [Ancistrocladus abbreviatus]
MDDHKEDEAIGELSKAIAFKPDLQLLHLRAAFHDSMGNITATLRDCEAALCLDSTHIDTLELYNRARERVNELPKCHYKLAICGKYAFKGGRLFLSLVLGNSLGVRYACEMAAVNESCPVFRGRFLFVSFWPNHVATLETECDNESSNPTVMLPIKAVSVVRVISSA